MTNQKKNASQVLAELRSKPWFVELMRRLAERDTSTVEGPEGSPKRGPHRANGRVAKTAKKPGAGPAKRSTR